MKLYLIKDNLQETTLEEVNKHSHPYVAVVTNEEFNQNFNFFDMGIDLDFDLLGPTMTKAEVNYDAVIGTFNIPDRKAITVKNHKFAFAFDEKGIAFINDDGYALEKINNIIALKKWRLPSLERFIFDFLEQITDDDLRLLEDYENKLISLESKVQQDDGDDILLTIDSIRNDINKLRLHYGQLQDLSQELLEDENEFFNSDNLRYFNMYANRISSLSALCSSLLEHCNQVRELKRATIEKKQNKLMIILTIISTIFMPLTLITGWYGMNFKYMPELYYKISYPIVIVVCITIVIVCVRYFKKNKWL